MQQRLTLAFAIFTAAAVILGSASGCSTDPNAVDGGASDLGTDPTRPRDLSVGIDFAAKPGLDMAGPVDMTAAALDASVDFSAKQGGDAAPHNDDMAGTTDGGVSDGALGDGAMAGDGGGITFTTVFTIVMENHDYKEIVGSQNAPYINSLIALGGLATKYNDSTIHPSLPNYLYMTSGDIQYPNPFNLKNLLFDYDPTQCINLFLNCFPMDVENLGHQLSVANVSWRAYAESMGMGATCGLAGAGPYAPKHVPFLYYKNIQTTPLCKANVVDFGSDAKGITTGDTFLNDLSAGTYRYMWITPNLNSDGHDPAGDPVLALKNSDAWLATWVPKILNSAVYKAGGVIFLTWDEAEARNGDDPDQVPMIVLSPRIVKPGYTSATPYSHANFLATVEQIFNVSALGAAKGAPTMMEFFK